MQILGYCNPAETSLDELMLFERAGHDSIEATLRHAQVYRAAPGEVVLAPNAPNTTVYVVLKGALRVDVVGKEGRDHSHVGRGECVGELSVIDGGPTSASVVAVDECELLALPGETVLQLVDRSHAVARNLVRLLSRRLRGSNRLLRDEAEHSELLRRQVSFDALTGLHSRAWLETMLPRLCSRARPGGHSFAVAMCDIDHFKRVNDTWGHLAGDRALQKVAAVLNRCLRPTDFAARYGGEEILAILYGTDAVEYAVVAAERIRRAVREIPLEVEPARGAAPSLTISIGVAVLRPKEASEELLRRADAALYRAKDEGRDRVAA